jgi:prepilin-type N-terminal cleavage/methylation domain-containing protein/prepilin-type processing-associated H-X9-DG protein
MKSPKIDKRFNHRMFRRKRHRGVTLTELMVVIVIIVILASISFPISKRLKTSANAAVCASNLRQVGAAMLMYAADNHQKLPPLQPPLNRETGKRGDIWPGLLARAGYMWDGTGTLPCGTGVWTCPDCDFMSNAYGGYGVAEDSVFVYGELKPAGTQISGSLKLSMIKNPSRTWLVGDATRNENEPNKGWYAIWSNPSRWNSHGPAERHRGKANVCMADGHVVALSKKEIEEAELTENVVR